MSVIQTTAMHLQLGDVVRYTDNGDSAYSQATVSQVTPKYVTLVRPYIHTSDVVYAGDRLITYIGQEEIAFHPNSSMIFDVIRRDTRFYGTSVFDQHSAAQAEEWPAGKPAYKPEE